MSSAGYGYILLQKAILQALPLGIEYKADRSYRDFQMAILQALPHTIDDGVVAKCLDDRDFLETIIEEALWRFGNPGCLLKTRFSTPEHETYTITVDYDRSVDDAIGLGLYHEVSEKINSLKFQTNQKGTVADIEVKIADFNVSMDVHPLLREIDKIGYRPIDIHELLAFCEQCPVQPFIVFAFGSILRDDCGCCRLVPYFFCERQKRILELENLEKLEEPWGVRRFPVIHK